MSRPLSISNHTWCPPHTRRPLTAPAAAARARAGTMREAAASCRMRIILSGCCFCCACRRPVDVRSMLGGVVALLLLGYVID